MNTPYPCYSCRHVYSNVLFEDDPNSSAECMIETLPLYRDKFSGGHIPKWGEKDCLCFQDRADREQECEDMDDSLWQSEKDQPLDIPDCVKEEREMVKSEEMEKIFNSSDCCD